MKLASKQLLALGVKPEEVVELEEHARSNIVELRVLVQWIIREWLREKKPNA